MQLGWIEIPYSPVLGHMVVQAERAEFDEASVAGRPAIWVNTGDGPWTLYARAGAVVVAVTGRDRAEVLLQMEQRL